MIQEVAVGYESKEQRAHAEKLAEKLALKIDNQAQIRLIVMKDKLALKVKDFNAIWIDFTSVYWLKRRQEKKPNLIKACQVTLSSHVLDATAGWGRDAALLASYGAKVTMLERDPILATLLRDALNRQDSYSRSKLSLQLIEIDAFTFLESLSDLNYPEVIYIDPMHPDRQKTALVKKDMQILQQLIEKDERALQLLQLARRRSKKRVVCKWPQNLLPLLQPDIAISGKTVRFDVYLTKPSD